MSFTDDAQNHNIEEAYNLKLQEEIEKMKLYRKSMEEEFANLDIDDPTTHKMVRNKLGELVPDACEVVLTLMLHAESESVRATLAKFVLTESMKSAATDKPIDLISEMFKDLAKNDDAVGSETADESSK
jgi:hypothetical protein